VLIKDSTLASALGIISKFIRLCDYNDNGV